MVGDAQPVDKAALDGEPLQHIADLRPTTMNDDRMDADLLEQGDVARERIVSCSIGHRVPTILHQDGPPGIAAQVRQCLVEDRGSDGRVGGGYDGGRGGGNHRAGTLSRSPRRHHPWPDGAEQQIQKSAAVLPRPYAVTAPGCGVVAGSDGKRWQGTKAAAFS